MSDGLRAPVVAYVALGANLGDARATVRHSIAAMAALDGVALLRASRLYRSAPVDATGPDYINAVVAVSTLRTAYGLFDALQHLEQLALRQRPYPNAPRTLDLDLLLFGEATIASASLQVPHPRMWQRAFVLLPLREIAPDLVGAAQLRLVADQPCVALD